MNISLIKIFLNFCIFVLLICNVFAQGQNNISLYQNIDVLKELLSKADTLSPFSETNDTTDAFDDISNVNDEISICLSEILTTPEIVNKDLDSLLDHSFLGKVHSIDNRLWIFTWYENTGGSWKSNLNLLHYRTKSNKPKVVYESINDENNTTELKDNKEIFSNGSWFEKIYKLKTKNKDLYLCMGNGISCNTCIYETAFVIELKDDGINLNYPAFPKIMPEGHILNDEYNGSYYILDARMYDIEKFEFEPKSQIFTIVYLTDDITPIRSDVQKRISSKLYFDGQTFILQKDKSR